MSTGDLTGTVGVSLLLLAFAMNLTRKWSTTALPYLLTNIAGAALACLSSYMVRFWPFVVLEGVWMISSIIVLLNSRRHA